MLLRFNVSNFLSFDSEQEFSMLPGKVQRFSERIIKDDKLNILKFCALYGANASGKSNLIKAIDTAKRIIVSGIDTINDNMYCKLKKENKEKPSKFEFEIKIKDSYYAYGFNVNLNDSIILGEWLYKVTTSGESKVFERDVENGKLTYDINFKDKSNKSKFDVYVEDIKSMNSVLLLSEINRKNLKEIDYEVFNEIFRWFNYKLKIIYPDTVLSSHFGKFKAKEEIDIRNLLDYFDTGITDYKLEDSSLEQIKKYMPLNDYDEFAKMIKKVNNFSNEGKKILKTIVSIRTPKNYYELSYEKDELTVKELLFKHGKNCDLMFNYGEESDGTRRLIELLDVI